MPPSEIYSHHQRHACLGQESNYINPWTTAGSSMLFSCLQGHSNHKPISIPALAMRMARPDGTSDLWHCVLIHKTWLRYAVTANGHWKMLTMCDTDPTALAVRHLQCSGHYIHKIKLNLSRGNWLYRKGYRLPLSVCSCPALTWHLVTQRHSGITTGSCSLGVRCM